MVEDSNGYSGEAYVAIEAAGCSSYPSKDDYFRPGEEYPEYPFKGEISKKDNCVYDAVRRCLIELGFDKENIGTPKWNPLGHLIKPGDKVFIKPNLVYDRNLNTNEGIDCVNTHPSVIAPILDYVVVAMGDSVENASIVLGDAPMQECDFDKLVSENGLRDLVKYYNGHGVPVKLVDCRAVTARVDNGLWTFLEQDSANHIVSLNNDSEFESLSDEQLGRLRKGANDAKDLLSHHHRGVHEYSVTDYLLECDVLINMPKPKCHKKAGVTIALKNLVGTCARKEYLPHHMEGDAETGKGDAYREKNVFKRSVAWARDKVYAASWNHRDVAAVFWKRVRALLIKLEHIAGFDNVYDGMWVGNETIPKMVIDINKIALFADKTGELRDTPQRRQLIVADMIVSGEGNGPLAPTAKEIGLVAMAENCPANFDECIATIMGADIAKIPTLRDLRRLKGKYNFVNNEPSSSRILSNKAEWNNKNYKEIAAKDFLGFVPIESWRTAFLDSTTNQ